MVDRIRNFAARTSIEESELSSSFSSSVGRLDNLKLSRRAGGFASPPGTSNFRDPRIPQQEPFYPFQDPGTYEFRSFDPDFGSVSVEDESLTREGASFPDLERAGDLSLVGASDPRLERSSGTPTRRGASDPRLERSSGTPTRRGASDPRFERGSGTPSRIGSFEPRLERSDRPNFSPFSTPPSFEGFEDPGFFVGRPPPSLEGQLNYMSEIGATINLELNDVQLFSREENVSNPAQPQQSQLFSREENVSNPAQPQQNLILAQEANISTFQEGAAIANTADFTQNLGSIGYGVGGSSINGASLIFESVETNSYDVIVPPYQPGLDMSASYPDAFPTTAFAIYEGLWAVTGTGDWSGVQVKTWLDSSGNDNHIERTGSAGEINWTTSDTLFNNSHTVNFDRNDYIARTVFEQGNNADIRTVLILAQFANLSASGQAELDEFLMDSTNAADQRAASFTFPYTHVDVGDQTSVAEIPTSSFGWDFGQGEVVPMLFTLSGAALDSATFQIKAWAGQDWYVPVSESNATRTVGGMDGILLGDSIANPGFAQFSGSIAMISLWDRVLDSQEIMTAAIYLNTNYGTTITFTASVAATSSWRPIDLSGGIYYWDPHEHVTASGQALNSIPDLITGGVGRNLESYSYTPTYHSTDTFFSGRAVCQFSSSQQQELLLSDLGTGIAQQFTIWTLVRYDAETSLYQYHFNNEYSSDFDVEVDLAVRTQNNHWVMHAENQPLTGSETQIGTVDTGSMYLVVAVYDGASSFLYANGVDRDLFPNNPGSNGPNDIGAAPTWVGINGDFTMTAMGILETGITADDHQRLLTWSVEQCGNSL